MRRCLSILSMILLAAAGFAQDAAGTEKVPRRLLVALEARPPGAYASSETAILEKSLVLSLHGTSGQIRIIDYGPATFPPSGEARNGEAVRLGADCWLWVSISGDRGAPILHMQSYDLLSRMTTIDQSFTRTHELISLDVPHEHWEEIVPIVAEKYQAAEASLVPKNVRRVVTLVIHALPETRVTGLPGGPLVTSAYGVATASLEAPSSYRIRASLEGYNPAEQEVYVDADREVQVVQQPASRLSAEASFFNAFFLGGDVGYYFLPDRAFLKVGVTSFLAGLSLSRDSLIYSFPLVQVNVQVGSYWAPEDAGLRWYTSIGGFFRFVFIPGFPARIDALSPGGFQLGLGAEIPIAGRSRFFFEYIPMLYLSSLPDLFVDSLGSRVPFGYVPLAIGALNFVNVRFGVRWML